MIIFFNSICNYFAIAATIVFLANIALQKYIFREKSYWMRSFLLQ